MQSRSFQITSALVGGALGALSIAGLLHETVFSGWRQSLSTMLDWWNSLVVAITFWIDPGLSAFIDALPGDLQLEPHWRHVVLGYTALYIPIFRPHFVRHQWLPASVSLAMLAWLVVDGSTRSASTPEMEKSGAGDILLAAIVMGAAVALTSYAAQLAVSHFITKKGLVPGPRVRNAIAELVCIRNGFAPAFAALTAVLLGAGASSFNL